MRSKTYKLVLEIVLLEVVVVVELVVLLLLGIVLLELDTVLLRGCCN
jgi:hypothetical protein